MKSQIKVTLCGGGGGGGGPKAKTASGGGSGAGTIVKRLSTLPGEVITFTIGQGGQGGMRNQPGQNGQNSILLYNGKIYIANGGLGGLLFDDMQPQQGQIGGSAQSVNDTENFIVLSGGNGGPPSRADQIGGCAPTSGSGGGSYLGPSIPGVLFPFAGYAAPGHNNADPMQQSPVPVIGNAAPGQSAQPTHYGSGGSGAYCDADSSAYTDFKGGNGGSGIIIFEC